MGAGRAQHVPAAVDEVDGRVGAGAWDACAVNPFTDDASAVGHPDVDLLDMSARE